MNPVSSVAAPPSPPAFAGGAGDALAVPGTPLAPAGVAWWRQARQRLDSIAGALLTTVAGGVISLVTAVVLNRLLGPVGRGEHARLLVPIQTLGPLFCLGFPNALLLCFDKQSRTIPSSLSRLASLSLASAIAACIVFAFARPSFAPADMSGIFLTMSVALLAAWAQIGISVIQATGNTARFNVLRVLSPAVTLAALLAFAAFSELSATTAIVSLGLASIACLGFSWVWTRRDRLRFVAESWRSRFNRFSMWFLLNETATTLSAQIDKIVCAALLPTRELGIYAATFALSRFVTPGFQAIASFVLVKGRDGSLRERRQILKRGVLYGLGMSTVAVLGAIIGGHFVVEHLLGPGFESVGVIFLLLVIDASVSGTALVLLQNENLAGRPESLLIRQCVVFVVAGTAAFIFIPAWGLLGAALTTLLASTVRLLISFYLLARDREPLLPTQEPRHV
jgi:stage V sporulation protein B